MPSNVSITSSRLSITPERSIPTIRDIVNKKINNFEANNSIFQYESNFSKKGNPFIMSKSSKRKLFDSVNYLYSLSPKRDIEMQTGKHIYNFKLAFITLTLPSKQNHSDTHIKSKYLNQFLIELRKHYNVNNYIWKAELQKNQNIHFHLILDKYIDYQALRRRWNRILEKGNYVSEYRNKMSKLSSKDYFKMRLDNCIKHNEKYNTEYSITFKESYKAYQKGVKSNWSNPNSVDVKNVYGKKDLAIYLSKYISKKDEAENESTELTERQISFGRSWSRSYSLVNMCKSIRIDYDDFKDLINYFRHRKSNCKRISAQFFEVFYFSLDELHITCKSYILDFINLVALNRNYIFPD